MNKCFDLIDMLSVTHSLSVEEYAYILDNRTPETELYLRERAVQVRKAVYGNSVYIRGLIEISNICKNNCYYCGIRAENPNCHRSNQ
mgnify:FL=1